MCIRLGVYSPKEGVSIEEAFKIHMQVHSPLIMEVVREVAIPGLNKYIVGRVTKEAVGKPPFTNYVHMTWDDEAAMNRYLEALKVRMPFPGDYFMDKVNWGSTSFVEEKVIFESKSAGKPVRIRFGFYTPKEGISVEEMFNYHTQVHAVEIMKVVSQVATPGLIKYVVGRITKEAVGKPLYTNYVKMWWEDEEAMNRYLKVLREEATEEDFFARADWGFTAFVEDEVAFEKK